MANKQISQLDPVTSYQNISDEDLFVMEQSNSAKKLSAGVLEAWLASMVNGVGYIASIEKTSTSDLVDTYTITFTDGTDTTFDVTNGKGIVSVRSVPIQSLDRTNTGITFEYSDGTTSEQIIIYGGSPGQNGRNGYIHFAWSANYPTQDSDISFDTPNNYLGVCANNSIANPTNYTAYQWMYARGATGEPGAQGEKGDPGAIPWRSTAAPTETSGKYYFDCTYVYRGIPVVDTVPQSGDILFYQDTYYTVNKTIVNAQTGIEYAECRDPYQFTGGDGTYDYDELIHQPQINGVTLSGNKTSSELNITAGISNDLKLALLQLAQKVAYIDDDGADYYQDLYDALYPAPGLVSIDAVFTQGGAVIYDTDSLDTLKQYLVVTALYDGGETEVVPSTDYTLSGTLTEGTSTITVSYGGKTDTFNVAVTWGYVITSASANVSVGSFDISIPPTYMSNVNASRIACLGDNLLGYPCEYGYKYHFSVTGNTYSTMQLAVSTWNTTAKNAVQNGLASNNDNRNSSGWQNITNGFDVTPAQTINGASPAMFWIAARKDTTNSNFANPPTDLGTVTITRVAV